jgi:tRNA (guanine26-N2/guanine27-N2)-dimethyltransferase
MLEARRGHGWPARHYGFVGHCHLCDSTQRVAWRDLGHAVCRRCGKEVARGGGGGGGGGGSSSQQASSSSSSSSSGGGSEKGSGKLSQQQEEQARQSAAVAAGRAAPLCVSGPMWTGPLHDRAFVEAMASEAAARGWEGHAVPLDSPYREKSSKNNRQRELLELLGLFAEEADPSLPPWYVHVDDIGRQLRRSPGRDVLITQLRAAGHAACRSHVEVRAIKTSASMGQVLAVAEAAAGAGAAGAGAAGAGAGAAAAAG